jgi:hypothetical protein
VGETIFILLAETVVILVGETVIWIDLWFACCIIPFYCLVGSFIEAIGLRMVC